MSRPTPQWFNQAPLGIMIHWGAYSVPAWAEPQAEFGELPMPEWLFHNAYAEWYANSILLEGSAAQRHHAVVWDGRPYAEFLDMWHTTAFNPDEWIDLFVRAGAGYIVPTTKHHDGFGLWEAPGTGRFNTVASGPRRDLIADLAGAARRRGMRLGLYYSGGVDWLHRPMIVDGVHGEHPSDSGYAEYAAAQAHDLIDRFAPDILWNDITWPKAGRDPGPASLDEVFAHLYRSNPEALINDRYDWGAPDYRTSEYRVDADRESDRVWENCRGIGRSFGYNQMETQAEHLTGAQAASYLVDVVSRGGHFLLNVGPTAEGEIPALQRACLEGLAEWMGVARPFLNLDGPRQDSPVTPGERRIAQSVGSAVFLDGNRLHHEVQLSGKSLAPVAWVDDIHVIGDVARVTLSENRPGPGILTLQ